MQPKRMFGKYKSALMQAPQPPACLDSLLGALSYLPAWCAFLDGKPVRRASAFRVGEQRRAGAAFQRRETRPADVAARGKNQRIRCLD